MSDQPPVSAPALGETLDVIIEKVVFGGDGLARVAAGFVLFIPRTAPGDRVKVRVTERKTKHGRAEVLELLVPSPSRAEPLCLYFGRCGGCQYQHLRYEEECRLKEEQVREAFVRGAKMEVPPVLPIIASPQDYGYRNRITVHAAEGRIGFHDLSGRDLVNIKACAIARPGVNQELATLRQQHPPDGHYSLRDKGIPRSGFFQSNQDLLETLLYVVTNALPASGALLLEGYCGGGFFTEAVADRFQKIKAMDNDPRTLRDAKRLGLDHVEWILGDAAQDLAAQLLQTGHGEATVLVDPPREGLPDTVVNALMFQPVPYLVYVSCDPATLARDARLLLRHYDLVSVQPIDLFPRTSQIECVTQWRRK